MKSFKVLMVVGVMMVAGSAFAQTDNFVVRTNVPPSCTVAVGDIIFGAYDPVDANATAVASQTATVSVRCTKGTTGVTVSLNGGANPAGDPNGNRAMAGLTTASELLGYTLRVTNAAGTLWGDNTAALGNAVPFSGWATNSAPVTQTVYGEIAAGQDDVSAQTYRDVVTATVNF